ncbi:MAG TPA: twin-arginine translocase TatA/TatE family subunit [Candidatus Saccharimonadales bacterium]|nr:twin-arginine translocase TatA/TatE family subunit [Candidatus Saccharimonadales bacterium]
MGKVEELLIVLLIILLLFGAKRIPDLAKSIGQSMREVRKGFNGEDSEPTSKKASGDKKTDKSS